MDPREPDMNAVLVGLSIANVVVLGIWKLTDRYYLNLVRAFKRADRHYWEVQKKHNYSLKWVPPTNPVLPCEVLIQVGILANVVFSFAIVYSTFFSGMRDMVCIANVLLQVGLLLSIPLHKFQIPFNKFVSIAIVFLGVLLLTKISSHLNLD